MRSANLTRQMNSDQRLSRRPHAVVDTLQRRARLAKSAHVRRPSHPREGLRELHRRRAPSLRRSGPKPFSTRQAADSDRPGTFDHRRLFLCRCPASTSRDTRPGPTGTSLGVWGTSICKCACCLSTCRAVLSHASPPPLSPPTPTTTAPLTSSPSWGIWRLTPALCSSACSPASLITSTPLGLISGRAGGDTRSV